MGNRAWWALGVIIVGGVWTAGAAGCVGDVPASGDPDAGVDATSTSLPDASDEADAAEWDSSDGGPVPDADDAGDGDACVPDDAAACAGKCGKTTVNNCGQPIVCAATCDDGGVCLGNGACCSPVPHAAWCANKCGATTDSCGDPIQCDGCDGGVACTGGACGCSPEPVAKTCAGKSCGTATNNCGQSVPCGSGGTVGCSSSSDVCEANGTCCTPDNATACAGRCGVTVTNNCGQSVTCPAACPGQGVCVATKCCTPDNAAACNGKACGTTTNNCGQSVGCTNTCNPQSLCGAQGAGPNACGTVFKSCADVKLAVGPYDGDYWINGGVYKPFQVHCAGMATATPAEYINLQRVSTAANVTVNYSTYQCGHPHAAWKCDCGTVTTFFSKVRLDPATLKVDVGDHAFAAFSSNTDQQCLQTQQGCPSLSPYSTAQSCNGNYDTSGRASVDLTGTPFHVAGSGTDVSMFQTDEALGGSNLGYTSAGSATIDATRKVVSITGGGDCGGFGTVTGLALTLD